MRLAKSKAAGLRARNKRGASQIAEFVPVLYILFLLFLMPLLNLATAFVAGAIQYLATNDICSKAATQPDYATALNSMTNEAYQFESNGLAQFVHLSPAGGYTGCGDDMYVLTTNTSTGAVTSSPANQGLTEAINTGTAMYELSVRSAYTVEPLVNLSSVPLLGDVPGLGKPIQLAFTANRPVEHPGGLQPVNGTGLGTGGGSGVTPFPRLASSSGTSTATSQTWRNPNIYLQIQAAGQTIVGENVFVVQANNPNMTPAGVGVVPGEKVWFDTQAVGVWNDFPEGGYADTDANGSGPVMSPPIAVNQFPSIGPNALVGQVGTNGTPFFVGDGLTNFTPSGNGPLTMMDNDKVGGYQDNTGAQLVRVIVTM